MEREDSDLTEKMARVTNSHRASAYAVAAALRLKLAVRSEEDTEESYEAGPDAQRWSEHHAEIIRLWKRQRFGGST